MAASHCLFNLSGCLIFIWLVVPFAALVQAVSPAGPEVEVVARQIANAHTLFNVIMTLLWLPFIGVMAKIATRILPDEGQKGQVEKDRGSIADAPAMASLLTVPEAAPEAEAA